MIFSNIFILGNFEDKILISLADFAALFELLNKIFSCLSH